MQAEMIPVNEFRNIASEQNPQYRVLKPWWDVFSEYLCIAMLMIGVFGCTVQLTQEKISCLPNRIFTSHDGDGDCNHLQEKTANESLLWEYSITKELKPNVIEVFGRKNGLDIHQYVFVNHYCYERAVHWYAKFFPYLVVIHSMVFMVASSFWFKFPGTSSKIELFVNILRKCFDSPWTTRAISEVSEERGEEKMVNLRKVSISSGHKIINPDGFAGTDGENITLLRSASVVSGGGGEKKLPEPAASVLDKKEGEQAKALFEKVKKFRTHVEEDDLLYKMYVIQTSLKVLKFVLIIIYAASLVSKIEIVVKCSVPPDLTGFKTFCCNHNRANLFSKLAYCYICFVGVYGLMCIYSLYWLFHRPLKEYSFEQVRLETGMNDIPDMKNDFAFLLHLSDRYDPLYAKRFAVFLSEVSESRLRQVNLNHEWTTKKLRARLSRNAGQRLELHLFMLTGLPDTVFEVPEIQSLKMELLSNITIPATLTQLPDLQELLLIHCSTKLQMAALNHLQANLKVLRVTFEGLEQMPLWMYSLQALEELHLSGPLNQEASRGGGSATLDTLRELKNLRVLTLRCHLTKLPPGVVDVAAQLQRLCVHNEGVKLQVLSNLKKLSNLTSLELMGCHLERIPSAVFSLNSLQELDLRENKLTTVEEILSLQHCQRLTTLRLWHNAVAYIPEHISKLHALETLDASWNKIRRLPSRLYYCTKLRHLDLSHNQLSALPTEIGSLQSLQYLSVAFNSLEALPEELFSCKRLKFLALGNNSINFLSPRVANLVQLVRLEVKGNRLESLPPEIGDCPLLKLSGIVVEQSLLELLPSEVRERMEHS